MSLFFDSLIQSILTAVAEAQNDIHQLQLHMLRQYFDEDGYPISLDVNLPVLSPDAEEGAKRKVSVPLISLIGARSLGIKDMKMNFEVGMSGQDLQNDNGSEGSSDDKESSSHRITVDLNALKNNSAGSIASITLCVESQPLSDGMARLMQQIDKQI